MQIIKLNDYKVFVTREDADGAWVITHTAMFDEDVTTFFLPNSTEIDRKLDDMRFHPELLNSDEQPYLFVFARDPLDAYLTVSTFLAKEKDLS